MSDDDQNLFGLERWSPTQLAEALGLSTQRISQLTKENVLPSPVAGRYAPLPAVKAYVQHLRQREAGRSKTDESVRKLRLENELRQIKLQKIAGELVPADRVARDWFDAGRRVRDGLLNLPNRLSGPFAAEMSQDKIYNSFVSEINIVLVELSSRPAPAPVAGRLPLGKTPEPDDPSTDQTAAVDDEDGDCDVEAHTDLDREAEHREDRFSTGD